MTGSLLSHSKSGLECLLELGIIDETKVIASNIIDPSKCLINGTCRIESCLLFDNPHTIFEDKELFNGLKLNFHYNRRHPLMEHTVLYKKGVHEPLENFGDQQGGNENNLSEANVLHIKPLTPTGSPSVLITGNTPVSQIVKMDSIDSEVFSVFFVPHQEHKESISLLPEDMQHHLSNPSSISSAALHLALYYMRHSLFPIVSNIRSAKLKEEGKRFVSSYRQRSQPDSFSKSNSKNDPEIELTAMLQDPMAKVSPFFISEDFWLKWYKEHEQRVFHQVMKAVSRERARQENRLELLRDSLAWAHFYKHIRAEVYVMSPDELKHDNRSAVLNGIILANFWRKTECCILIPESLPCSLNQIVQQDVRKLAFPEGKTTTLVKVIFLDNSVPFFTINPWSHVQAYESLHPTISVDNSEQRVHEVGVSYRIDSIRDDLDIMKVISTTSANSISIVDNIAQHMRPKSHSTGHCSSETLIPYLKGIGHKNACTVSDVLACLIGPSIISQLSDCKHGPEIMTIIPELLKQEVHNNSTFLTTPTKSSAREAEVILKQPLRIKDKLIESAKFIIKKARTMSVDITLRVIVNSKHVSCKVSKYVDVKGSCGKTIADFISDICYKDDVWLSARKKLTVGGVLNIFFGQEKAVAAIQSLPLFLSYSLSKCIIKHYLTTVAVDSNQSLQEAHIHVIPLEISHAPFSHKFNLQFMTLTMHFHPLLDIDYEMITILGECTVNGEPIKFSCSSAASLPKHVEFYFLNVVSANQILKCLGLSCTPDQLTSPISEGNLSNDMSYKGGFVLSQLLESTEEVSLTSLFFVLNIKFHCIQHFLPTVLDCIDHAEIKSVLHLPSMKLGLQACFLSKLKLHSVDSTEVQCCLSISPSVTKNGTSYTNQLIIRQFSDRCKPEDIVSVLSGENLVKSLREISTLGEQILNKMSIKKIILLLRDRDIKDLDVQVAITELDILQDRMSVQDCLLSIVYSKDKGLRISGSGRLVLFDQYDYLIQYSLPTLGSDGKICFSSCSKNLVFKKLLQEFGWLTSDVTSNPILHEVLESSVRSVEFVLHYSTKNNTLLITAANITIFKDVLKTSIVTFHNIELDISIKLSNINNYSTTFKLSAYISQPLHAKFVFIPDKNILTGEVRMTPFKSASAIDVLETFQSSLGSYDNMKSILKKKFMGLFNSDMKVVAQPGMTAYLNVTIALPSKQQQYFLQCLNLEVEDALKICCNARYMFNRFKFEFIRNPSEEVSSTSHLAIEVHKLNSIESMTLDFDLSCKNDSKFLTAKVAAGPLGGFLKLRSVIDIAQAALPGLPKFNVGLPPIFDIELLSGSVTFALETFRCSEFDINILISKWKLLDDPEITVHELTLKTTWTRSDNYPQLTFTDCSLTFMNHKLYLSGRLTSDEVLIKCSSAEKLHETKSTEFKSILKDCTPASQSQPVLPKNIRLPPMIVRLREFVVHIQKDRREFCIDTSVISTSPWKVEFGSNFLPVHELGGSLNWEKTASKRTYKALLHGSMELFGMRVDIEMLLGKDIDSVVSASVRHPQSLHYSQIADHLLCSEAITPYSQYRPDKSGLSELVPSNLQGVSLFSASAALNITKKQFYISSEVPPWGSGSLLVGYIVGNKDEMDYVVSLSLNQGFKLSSISDSIAFVDELISIQKLEILVSSTDLPKFSDITKHFYHTFSESPVCKQLEKPFYAARHCLEDLNIQAGTTFYAEIDLVKSKGMETILQLGDLSGGNCVSVMAYIGKSNTRKHIEINAWIPRILLFRLLEFSDIHVIYQVHKAWEFKLTGTVALQFYSLQFYGVLQVDQESATFTTSNCKDLISRPYGINVRVKQLKLAVEKKLKSTVSEPLQLKISGQLSIGSIYLSCRFISRGVNFKVFDIKLKLGLTLSAVFNCTCSEADWPVLNINIKEGRFYYADSSIAVNDDGETYLYQKGYHLKAIIALFNEDFEIGADIIKPDIVLYGRSVNPINFGFAKITGKSPDTLNGPQLRYVKSEKTIALTVGIHFFNFHCFDGELKYYFKDKSFEGIIQYPRTFLWFDKPSMTVRWSKAKGFKIVNFSIFGENVACATLVSIISTIAKVISSIISGGVSFSFKVKVTSSKNPDPSKYLMKFKIRGTICISIIGIFDIPVITLPPLPVLLLKDEDFSFNKLPSYIWKCIKASAGEIWKSVCKYLNPWLILKKSAKLIWDGIKCVANTVVNVGKKIVQGVANTCKKVWRGICSIFGGSAFIFDSDSGIILGYIRGGKNGLQLRNERFTVEHFGPILTANAIGTMAYDMHRHFKSCLDAQTDQLSLEEVDGEEDDLEMGLNNLKEKAEDLNEMLSFVADKVLAVKEVSIKIVNEGNGICLEWITYNPEDEKVSYNGDIGDIEYYAKIIATVKKNKDFSTVTVYDDIYLNESEEVQNPRAKEPPECVCLQIPFDLCNIVFIYVRIQPKVTLEVKMLPPEKIGLPEFKLEPSQMQNEEDTSWMTDVKQEIIKNGRINEVTLEGMVTCTKHVLKSASERNIQFTVQCQYKERSLIISGDITAVPQADCYLVQLVDRTDLTIVIKQCKLLFHQLNYKLEVVLSDFPETSSGPYQISIIALGADHSTCLAFTDSDPQMNITRYCAPEQLSEVLPDLDSSNSDIVQLEWKLPKFDLLKPETDFVSQNEITSEDVSQDPPHDNYQPSVVGESEDSSKAETQDKREQIPHFYTVSINGIIVKRPKDFTNTEPDVDGNSDVKAFKLISEPIYPDQQSQVKCRYEFSIRELLQKYDHKILGGLLFQCHVVTNGLAKLRSIPKFFNEFILLAPPMDLFIVTSECLAGLYFRWEYSAHAIQYKLEVEDQSNKTIAFSKVLNCDAGSHGEALLTKSDFKSIPCSTDGQGYKLQMYSLGFSQVLIRCLHPTVANGLLHVIPIELQYLNDLNKIQIRFKHFGNIMTSYKVELYRVTGEETLLLTTDHIYDLETGYEAVIDFSLKRIWHLLQSGDTIIGWVCSVEKEQLDAAIYIGTASQEMCVIGSTELQATPYYHLDFTLNQLKLTWSDVSKANHYLYGLYITDKNKCISVGMTQEKGAIVTFEDCSVRQFHDDNIIFHFQVYVVAEGKPGMLITGELALATIDLYCIILHHQSAVVFTPIQMQHIWTKNLIDHANCNYPLPTKSDRYILFPSGKPFQNLKIPKKLLDKFWETGSLFFGSGKH